MYNVNRAQGVHLTFLQRCWTEDIDVIIVTEPWIARYRNNTTQTHPGYNIFVPVDIWDTKEENRPRVMIYTRRGNRLRVERGRPVHKRDLIWLRSTATVSWVITANHPPTKWLIISPDSNRPGAV